MSKPIKSALEIHLDNLIKGCRELWVGYKKWLQQVQVLLNELQEHGGITSEKGDCYVRFSASDDQCGLNNLFFVCEIGNIVPTLRWRHIIRSTGGLSYVLLQKRTSYIPAFSFSLDRFVTLVYWGEHAPFLSTMDLRELKLKDFILKTANASSVEISAANLVWPRLGYPFVVANIEPFATQYVFNSLRPPVLDSLFDIWSASPIVLVGDKIVTLITIHKTLCTIDKETVKLLKQKEVLNAKAFIIDHHFLIKQTTVDIPVEYSDSIFEKDVQKPLEVIFVRFVRVKYDPTTVDQKPYIRYVIYPFDSVKMFGPESFGSVLTLSSMKLRESYLQSKNPFDTNITPQDLVRSLRVMTQLPYISTKRDELAFRLLGSREGAKILASLLGIYEFGNNHVTFKYIHPALLECFLTTIKDNVNQTELACFFRVALKYLEDKLKSPSSYISPFLIEDLFYKEFRTNINFATAKLLRKYFFHLMHLVIPLSKGLNFSQF
ncbi:MAG: hypothetical protein QXR45_09170 [Candidatus Bathyarchaeia archaeon]